MKTITKSALAAAVLGALMLSAAPTTVMAAGGASGAAAGTDRRSHYESLSHCASDRHHSFRRLYAFQR